MGCCLITAVLLGAPRLGLFLWWILDPARFSLTFSSWVLPVAGFLILPWTTLAYVFVAPGGVSVFDWVIIGVALLIDLGAFSGGRASYRRRRAD